MQSLENFRAVDLSVHLAKAGCPSAHPDERLAFGSICPRQVVSVSVAKLDAAFQPDCNYVPDLAQPAGYASYLKKVGIGGMEWHMKKYRLLTQALPQIAVLQCPRISFSKGKASFFDGITRFTLLRDRGFRTFQVQVPREECVDEYTEALGGERTTTAPLSPDLIREWSDALYCALALLPMGAWLEGYSKVTNPIYVGFLVQDKEPEGLLPARLASEKVWMKDGRMYASRDILPEIGRARLLHVAYHTLKESLTEFSKRL